MHTICTSNSGIIVMPCLSIRNEDERAPNVVKDTTAILRSAPSDQLTPYSGSSALTLYQKLAISIVLAVICLPLLVYLFFGFAYPRLRRRHTARTSSETEQPFFANKAELEDKQKRKYELEARERQFELNGGIESARYEMPTAGDIVNSQEPSLSTQIMQELSGGEAAQEMDTPWGPEEMGQHIWAVR